MQRIRLAALIFASAATLTACGVGGSSLTTPAAADASALTEAAYIHKIQPLGVDSRCFGSNARTVRDHRVDPPAVYQEYFLGMRGCSAPESSLVVNMLGGQQWVGGYSFVTIKKNGLCLTSLVQAGSDSGETQWKACVSQQSSTPERYRQQWLLVFNNNNALQIQSHAGPRLGIPGAEIQCLDRSTPIDVKRTSCSLHNWQIVRG